MSGMNQSCIFLTDFSTPSPQCDVPRKSVQWQPICSVRMGRLTDLVRLFASLRTSLKSFRNHATTRARQQCHGFTCPSDEIHLAIASRRPGNNPGTHRVGCWKCRRASLDVLEKGKVLALLGFEPPDRPARSLVTIPTDTYKV